MQKFFAVIAALMAAAGCSAPSPGPFKGLVTEEPADLPSILLVTIDALRADHVGAYGYFRDTTPNIDALAAEAIVFEKCLAPMATTLPSHVSLLTGTYPPEHGVLANIRVNGQRFEMSAGLRSFPEHARSLGYETAAFVSGASLKRHSGIQAGFDVFDEPDRKQRPAEETLTRVSEWLEDRKEEMFFLWVHFYDPHKPYNPPPPYDSMFERDTGLESYMEERGIPADWPEIGTPKNAGETTYEYINRYDGEVRYVDDQFGHLRAAMEQRGLWQNLVLIVVSDHGEGLGQHGEAYHGDIHGEQLRTPLMVKIPGEPTRKISRMTSLADVFPTVVSLLEATPWTLFMDQATGHNALTVDEGRAVFSQRPLKAREAFVDPVYALTTSRWKYIHEPGDSDRLFDLESDPHELREVQHENPEIARRLRGELDARLKDMAANARRFGLASTPEGEEVDQKILKELRSLGYVN